jgi:5-methyltetrahydrofolate--homocysteine methyltransferase
VIDLGVMVPCEKILETARAEHADVIGLSGLITPSLDEMVHVAREMQRQGFTLPLLIGGATTSARHTAVKIAPHYAEPVVHVKDAALAVPAIESLLDADRKPAYVTRIRTEQERDRQAFAQRQERKLIPYAEALARRPVIDWQHVDIPRPTFTGVRVIDDCPLSTLRPYIDWSPFFLTWGLVGKYPRIFEDAEVGCEARRVFDDAQALLDRIIAEKLLTARGVYGIFPAHAEGDDLVVETGGDGAQGTSPDTSGISRSDGSTDGCLRFPMLRQQWARKGQEDFRSLADYVAPRESSRTDYLGAFAVTAGHGCDELARSFEALHDDYHAIMAKALADRLAEAFAEWLHHHVRTEVWRYERAGELSNVDLIEEKYRGIRPAFGYPSCPDHTLKGTLWDLLGVEEATGIRLTESYAMWPGASVSGLYFAHPQARYFAVDRVTRDQLASYAARCQRSLAEVERWLAPNLGYEPVSGTV